MCDPKTGWIELGYIPAQASMIGECADNPHHEGEKSLQHNDFFARSKVLHAEFCHAFENIEKRYIFLSRLFRPSGSDFSTKE